MASVVATCLGAAAKKFGLEIDAKEYAVGGAAIDQFGHALPDHTLQGCRDAQAIFSAPSAARNGKACPPASSRERAALLPLRKHFGLYAKPASREVLPRPAPRLADQERVDSRRFDVLVVRELTADFISASPSAPSPSKAASARSTPCLHHAGIERITHVAFKAARLRRQRVTLIDKANVPRRASSGARR